MSPPSPPPPRQSSNHHHFSLILKTWLTTCDVRSHLPTLSWLFTNAFVVTAAASKNRSHLTPNGCKLNISKPLKPSFDVACLGFAVGVDERQWRTLWKRAFSLAHTDIINHTRVGVAETTSTKCLYSFPWDRKKTNETKNLAGNKGMVWVKKLFQTSSAVKRLFVSRMAIFKFIIKNKIYC